jgi:hypothetical protein
MSDEAKAVHAVMFKARELLLSCRVSIGGISPDTAFAIGEAAGHVAKAMALAGRDIDQAALQAALAPTPRKRRSRAKVENAVASPATDLLRQ